MLSLYVVYGAPSTDELTRHQSIVRLDLDELEDSHKPPENMKVDFAFIAFNDNEAIDNAHRIVVKSNSDSGNMHQQEFLFNNGDQTSISDGDIVFFTFADQSDIEDVQLPGVSVIGNRECWMLSTECTGPTSDRPTFYVVRLFTDDDTEQLLFPPEEDTLVAYDCIDGRDDIKNFKEKNMKFAKGKATPVDPDISPALRNKWYWKAVSFISSLLTWELFRHRARTRGTVLDHKKDENKWVRFFGDIYYRTARVDMQNPLKDNGLNIQFQMESKTYANILLPDPKTWPKSSSDKRLRCAFLLSAACQKKCHCKLTIQISGTPCL